MNLRATLASLGPDRQRIAGLALSRAIRERLPMVEAVRLTLAQDNAAIDAQRQLFARADPGFATTLPSSAAPDTDEGPDNRPWWQKGAMA